MNTSKGKSSKSRTRSRKRARAGSSAAGDLVLTNITICQVKNDGNMRRRVENKDGVSVLIDVDEDAQEPPKPTDVQDEQSAYHHSVQDNELLASRDKTATLMQPTDRLEAGADNFGDSIPPQDVTIITDVKPDTTIDAAQLERSLLLNDLNVVADQSQIFNITTNKNAFDQLL